MNKSILLCGVFALSACSAVGPDFLRPSVELSDTFAFASSATRQAVAQDQWWKTFGDSALDQLMEQGLQSNLDIRTAQFRIAQANALLRAEGVRESQLSGNLSTTGPDVVISDDGSTSDTNGRAVLNGNFVLDLFGRGERRREAARASREATVFDAEATRIAYQVDLAVAVIEARFFQAAIASTQRRIGSRQQILSLTQQMFDSRQLTRENVVRSEADLAQAQADLPAFRNGLHLSTVRIATLLDTDVHVVAQMLKHGAAGQPAPSGQVVVGVPADLLRNRPDVMAAEQRLAVAFAQIGVREADLYPALSLDGNILLAASSSQFSLGPRLSLPVLSRGRLIALRDAAVAEANAAELQWRASIRGAVADVERSLVQIDTARSEIAAYGRAVNRYRTLLRLTRETYQIGASTLLELLDAEQEIRLSDLNLIRARRDLALAVARLAVATGSGTTVGRPVQEPVARALVEVRDAG